MVNGEMRIIIIRLADIGRGVSCTVPGQGPILLAAARGEDGWGGVGDDVELMWLRTRVEVVDGRRLRPGGGAGSSVTARVSAHIANLERELGCCLIERRVRPLTLTEEGKLLLPKARAVLAAAAEQGTLSGSVKVASFASASAEFLPQVFTKLKSAHPQVEPGVLDGDVNVIEAALSERRVSVALHPLRPEPRDRA